MISFVVDIIFRLITLIIIAACILSWLPTFDRRKEPVKTINYLFDALVSPFRFIPPIGMIDISPIVAFLVYSFVARFLIYNLVKLGL